MQSELTAQQIASKLHDEMGLSDGKIAEETGYTREYINRIRAGKKTASEELTYNLRDLLEALLEEGTQAIATPQRQVQRASAQRTETPTESAEGELLPAKWLLTGAGVIVGASLALWYFGGYIRDMLGIE